MDGNKNTEYPRLSLEQEEWHVLKKKQQQVEFDDNICVGFDDTLKQKMSFWDLKDLVMKMKIRF